MKNRKVYIVMGHCAKTKSTYVSEVCTTKKKAEDYKEYIEVLMKKNDLERYYWIYDARVV
jgi:hypothetical protein